MRSILFVTVVAIINLTLMASTQNIDLPRSTPDLEGVEPQAIATFVDSLMAVPLTDIHHVIIVRHGKVIAEAHPAPFERDELHTLFSCSKTFTMLAIGMLVDDGKLSVDDRVVELLPDIAPAVVTDGHKTMTVKHLLTMCAGIKPNVIPSHDTGNWARTWLAQPVTRQGKFQYDPSKGRFRCYFRKLVVARCIKIINKRTPVVPDDIDIEKYPLEVTDDDCERRAFLLRRALKEVERTMESTRVQCFKRCKIEGESPANVATDLEISLATAYNYCNVVMEKVKALVKVYSEQDD